jgi:hypothetical protein
LSALVSAPPELRTHLPLLWPDGPGSPVDAAALQALSQEYARSGRDIGDLLADLDNLCAVIGIGTPSSVIEASSSAWADAFLGTVAASGGTRDEVAAMAEVERRIVRGGAAWHWGDLAPADHLLIVAWSSPPTGPADTLAGDLDHIVGLVRSFFRGAAVAAQPSLSRVVAAVSDAPDLAKRVAALEAACSEFAFSVEPAVSLRVAPSDATAAADLLRRAS